MTRLGLFMLFTVFLWLVFFWVVFALANRTAIAAPSSFCETVRWYAAKYTAAQLEQMADRYGMSERDKRRARRCLHGRKQ